MFDMYIHADNTSSCLSWVLLPIVGFGLGEDCTRGAGTAYLESQVFDSGRLLRSGSSMNAKDVSDRGELKLESRIINIGLT